MTLTRDKDCPPEVGDLLDLYGRLSDGHDLGHVLSASVNMTARAILMVASEDQSQAIELAEQMAKQLVHCVRVNIDREAKSTDVPVGRRLS